MILNVIQDPKPGRNRTLQLSQQDPLQGRVAYQGAPGGYGEELAGRICPGLEPLPCGTYEDVFLALSGFAADKALLPLEDSLGGTIYEVLDLFLRCLFALIHCTLSSESRSCAPLAPPSLSSMFFCRTHTPPCHRLHHYHYQTLIWHFLCTPRYCHQ